MLHHLSHVPESFCPEIELCAVECKKLAPETNLYKIDRHTCKFLVQDDLHKFLVQVSLACVTGLRFNEKTGKLLLIVKFM